MARTEDRAYERRWAILAVLCFSLLIIVLDNSILNVAIPTIIRDLDASNSQLQWIIDSYTLVFAGLLLTAGALGDRFGRRGALQVGFVIFGLGSVLSAVATTADHLIVTRAIMGIGGALIMPATLSIITNVFPAGERGRAIGIWAGVAGLGGALGPLAGGFLIEHFYWGSVFLVNIPIVVAGLIAGALLIPTSKDPDASKLDPAGAVLSIVGLTALLYAIIEAPVMGWGEPTILASLVGGLALLGGFVWWERRTDHPMLDVAVFRNPRFSAASGAIALVFFAMFGSMFLLTQYFQFVLGYTPLETGVRMLPFAGSMMIFAPSSARIVERIGTKVTVTTGLAMVTIGLLTMATVGVDSSYLDVIWRLMLIAAGMGLTMAPATDSIMGSLPLAKAGVGSAINDTTRQVGGALGVAVIGSVLSSTYGSRIADFFAGQPVSAEVVASAQASLGGAAAVAAELPAIGADLLATANQAFVESLHWGMLVAAVPSVIGAVTAFAFLPARARAGDVLSQVGEFRSEHAGDPAVAATSAADLAGPALGRATATDRDDPTADQPPAGPR